ncbi:MAG TPA: undecaprenyl-diphosphate phosphatase [Bacteroidia bacterium]|jgi:undecaprenyl-diphosphatase|nr:undecaprenyl-diphosphate phosphatase [Bacteroidia bacterium]
MNLIQSVILAIVEGITEFLPISSTGHMIIFSNIMGIQPTEYVKMFTIAIQFGAILSVVALYWKRFIQSFDFYIKLFIAFLPIGIIGFLFHKKIDALLENVTVVGITLLAGGVVFLFIDKWLSRDLPVTESKILDKPLDVTEKTPEELLDNAKALKIGFFQAIAVIPGVSRSAATIIGGLTQNLSRKAAAEFSFLLAVPTMFVATLFKLYKYQKEVGFHKTDLSMLALGNAIAFLVAIFAIRFFIRFVTKHGFKVFGWYRILVGGAILACYFLKVPLQIL